MATRSRVLGGIGGAGASAPRARDHGAAVAIAAD
jgi:hypothetical protein